MKSRISRSNKLISGSLSKIFVISLSIILLSTTFSSSTYVIPEADALGLVSPGSVYRDLGAGQQFTIEKKVTRGVIQGTPDIYFLADTTGTMGPTITQMQSNITAIQNNILALQPEAQFGAGDYKDFPIDGFTPYAFDNKQSITGNITDIQTAVDSFSANGGGDFPEGQFYALDYIASNPSTIGWRDYSSRILLWFGDAPGHDPVCGSISGLGYDITEANMITKLQNQNITVIAMSMDGFLHTTLNDDPSSGNVDYPGCVQTGVAGQATRITNATNGYYTPSLVDPADIADEIMNSLSEVNGDVVPDVTDCTNQGLEVTFVPPQFTNIPSQTTVSFDETVKIPAEGKAIPYTCSVIFRNGALGGALATQTINLNGGSSGETDYPQGPTIGKDDLTSRQYVTNGFCIDEKCLTVTEYWHEEFGWILDSGNHTIAMKIYCEEGVHSCSHVGLSTVPLGIFNVKDAIWKIEIDKKFGSKDWRLFVTDTEDYIGKVSYTTEVIDGKYLLVKFTINFEKPTKGNVALGVHLWDWNRSLRNFWFNEGITVPDSFSYPTLDGSYESAIKIPKVCKIEEDSDNRFTCTFANKVLDEIEKAKAILASGNFYLPKIKSFD